MKLLFYIRHVHGKTEHLVKHPDYMVHDDQNEVLNAFFESPRPIEMIINRRITNRINEVIQSLQTTLPYVRKTIELINQGPFSRQEDVIYTYLGLVVTKDQCEIQCAFATFERIKTKNIMLKQIFKKISEETTHPGEIFNIQESRGLIPSDGFVASPP